MGLTASSVGVTGRISSNAKGSGEVTPVTIRTTNLRYWMKADDGVFSDPAGTTTATDTDTVGNWLNHGNGQSAAIQSDAARRPVFRTGGLNGRPYISCDRLSQQYFADLDFAQPEGITAINPYTVFAVTDTVGDLTSYPALLGSEASNGGKVAVYFRPNADQQIHFLKHSLRLGNVANPQVLMCAAGRTETRVGQAYSTYWIRQNRINLWSADQTTNAVSTEIPSTQFLHSSAITAAAPGGGYFHGRLYEFLLYDSVISADETYEIEDYLSAKYGIA